jgi:hypothetical protein
VFILNNLFAQKWEDTSLRAQAIDIRWFKPKWTVPEAKNASWKLAVRNGSALLLERHYITLLFFVKRKISEKISAER